MMETKMNNQDDFWKFYKLYQQNLLDDIKNLNIKFVRSQNYISEYKKNATGRQISAFEMAVIYGDKINEILDYGSAKLRISKVEPALSFKNARESLGLTIKQVANRLNLSEREVADAEDYTTRTKFSILSSIAHLYGITDYEISSKQISKDRSYLTNLKTFSKKSSLELSTICEISTAIWIAKTQKELEKYLDIKPKYSVMQIQEKMNSISNLEEPYKIGYRLAEITRDTVDLSSEFVNIKEIYDLFGVPLIQTDLSESIAGVTICNNDFKAVIINSDKYHNEISKRMTLAHELCHVLFDNEDEYFVDLKNHIDNDCDNFVEKRANAFAIYFLAPLDKFYQENAIVDPEEISAKFGISKYEVELHMKNFSLNINKLNNFYDSHEKIKHNITKVINDISIDSIPKSRRGTFYTRVIQALNEKILLPCTAASYLHCSESDLINIQNECEKSI